MLNQSSQQLSYWQANRDCWVWGHVHVLQCISFSVHVNGLI